MNMDMTNIWKRQMAPENVRGIDKDIVVDHV